MPMPLPIGIINDGHGDWRSLRCLADMPSDAPRGLQMQPTNLSTNNK
jgi:hypothetical protein